MRLEQTYGLNKAQIGEVLRWSSETLAFVAGVAAAGGVACRHPGRCVTKLPCQVSAGTGARGSTWTACLDQARNLDRRGLV